MSLVGNSHINMLPLLLNIAVLVYLCCIHAARLSRWQPSSGLALLSFLHSRPFRSGVSVCDTQPFRNTRRSAQNHSQTGWLRVLGVYLQFMKAKTFFHQANPRKVVWPLWWFCVWMFIFFPTNLLINKLQINVCINNFSHNCLDELPWDL